ncbi:MAG: hypothetical protein IJ725_00060, partial [Ruminococcus sp.]|nr:hypothetical protein [Ruminococcus sp.]
MKPLISILVAAVMALSGMTAVFAEETTEAEQPAVQTVQQDEAQDASENTTEDSTEESPDGLSDTEASEPSLGESNVKEGVFLSESG